VRKGGRNELRGQRAWVTIQDEERKYSSTQVPCDSALHNERLTSRGKGGRGRVQAALCIYPGECELASEQKGDCKLPLVVSDTHYKAATQWALIRLF